MSEGILSQPHRQQTPHAGTGVGCAMLGALDGGQGTHLVERGRKSLD